MGRQTAALVAGLLYAGFAGTLAHAADAMTAPAAPMAEMTPDPIVNELRLGLFAHDPDSREGGSVDINGEILFAKPFTAQGYLDLLLPRPHVGATVNTAGRTSALYAGATWQLPVTEWFFVEASFGGGVHNGSEEGTDDMSALGCSPLFRESFSAGVILGSAWTVMGTIDHMSNAGLCDENRGLTNFGMRVGYRF